MKIVEQSELKEDNTQNKKKSPLVGIVVAILIIIVIIGAYMIITKLNGEENEVDNLIYRGLENSDVTFSYEVKTSSIIITIQANTDIESLSADINITDSDSRVIESKSVSYSKIKSGARYEVVFNLSFADMLKANGYSVKNLNGKVKR